jgi:UDP-glucose 4-epimerase
VADALTDAGYKVVIFDCKESPYLRSGQEMIVGDILDEKLVEKVIKECEIVYNFSGIADLDEAAQKPLESVKTNILGNAIILEACRKVKVKRFVFASTLYVYSKTGSFYRSTKQACELLIENYNEVFEMPYTVLRYGSLYGPRADENNAIYRFIKQALTEGKITRYGDGEELREYIHVFDAARGSVEILSEEFINQHVIVTGHQQMRIKDLLMMIKEMLNNEIEIEFLPSTENHHYEITPYSFAPKIGKRLTSKTYLDLGQGILDSIYKLYSKLNPLPIYNGIFIKDGKDGT